MNTKFSPGPWKVVRKNDNVSIEAASGEVIADDEPYYPQMLNEDNADLIASAPELYAALERAVELYGQPGGPWNVPSDPGSWIEQARKALKNARGEA